MKNIYILTIILFIISCGDKPREIIKRYDNGQIEIEGNFKDGEKDGKTTNYYENGQIRSEDKNMRTKKELEEIIRKIKSGEMEILLRKWTDRFRKKLERWKEGW